MIAVIVPFLLLSIITIVAASVTLAYIAHELRRGHHDH